MAKSTRWVVTLSDAGKLAQVQRDLREAGFEVAQVLGEIGVIIGTADSAVASRVGRIRGVADISPEGRIDVGPPGSPDSW